MKGIRCTGCGTALATDEMALCMRLFGRGTARFQCLPCMAAALGTTQEELQSRIEYFKRGGCELFERLAPLQGGNDGNL